MVDWRSMVEQRRNLWKSVHRGNFMSQAFSRATKLGHSILVKSNNWHRLSEFVVQS